MPIPDGPEDVHKRIWQLGREVVRTCPNRRGRSGISTVYADSQMSVELSHAVEFVVASPARQRGGR